MKITQFLLSFLILCSFFSCSKTKHSSNHKTTPNKIAINYSAEGLKISMNEILDPKIHERTGNMTSSVSDLSCHIHLKSNAISLKEIAHMILDQKEEFITLNNNELQNKLFEIDLEYDYVQKDSLTRQIPLNILLDQMNLALEFKTLYSFSKDTVYVSISNPKKYTKYINDEIQEDTIRSTKRTISEHNTYENYHLEDILKSIGEQHHRILILNDKCDKRFDYSHTIVDWKTTKKTLEKELGLLICDRSTATIQNHYFISTKTTGVLNDSNL